MCVVPFEAKELEKQVEEHAEKVADMEMEAEEGVIAEGFAK